MLSDARTKGNAVIEEAESLAKQKKDKIVEEAEKQAGDTLAVAQDQIEKERQSMLSDMKDNVMGLALKLNEKLFQDEKASKDFMKKHIDTL